MPSCLRFFQRFMIQCIYLLIHSENTRDKQNFSTKEELDLTSNIHTGCIPFLCVSHVASLGPFVKLVTTVAKYLLNIFILRMLFLIHNSVLIQLEFSSTKPYVTSPKVKQLLVIISCHDAFMYQSVDLSVSTRLSVYKYTIM